MNVLIPVKSLSAAKSRLAGYLSLEERKKLMLQMLTHVITTIKSCETLTQIAIVTPDLLVQHLAKQNGIKILHEEKPGYNEALTYAAHHENEHPLLTIAADLPLVTTQDILQLITRAQRYDLVLARSKDGGTNALVTKQPLLIPYLFGQNSFEKYKQEAAKRKLSIGVYQSETIAFDIDTPQDLQVLQEIKRTSKS